MTTITVVLLISLKRQFWLFCLHSSVCTYLWAFGYSMCWAAELMFMLNYPSQDFWIKQNKTKKQAGRCKQLTNSSLFPHFYDGWWPKIPVVVQQQHKSTQIAPVFVFYLALKCQLLPCVGIIFVNFFSKISRLLSCVLSMPKF